MNFKTTLRLVWRNMINFLIFYNLLLTHALAVTRGLAARASRSLILTFIIALSFFGLTYDVQAEMDEKAGKNVEKLYTTTIPPLAMILSEVCDGRAQVKSLLPPGASPHTYEPKPSDIKIIEKATAFFYVHESVDGWAVKFQNKNKYAVLNLVPRDMVLKFDEHAGSGHDHEHSGIDGHFWHDPLTVKAMLPGLVKILSDLDKEGAITYKTNADKFSAELDKLDAEITSILKPYKGENVLLFHPAWNYFLKRYGLNSAGSIESSPGKEPTAKYIAGLIRIIREKKVKAILTEPQFSISVAKTLSKEAKIPIYTLDPLGGYEGRNSYRALMLYNTEIFRKAFSQNKAPGGKT